MPHRNLELLIAAAEKLRPILDQLVFVGGCTTGLLITDEAAAEVRSTIDVDAIAEIFSYADYTNFSEKLRNLGFTLDTSEGAPTCRFRSDEVILDVMPLDKDILGFSNRWYMPAMESAEEREIASGLRIRVVTAPYFCATKLEAFAGRGQGDYLASRDLEDLVTVIDGRLELIEELREALQDIRSYVADEITHLLDTVQFIDALPGYVPHDEGRVVVLLGRLQEISTL